MVQKLGQALRNKEQMIFFQVNHSDLIVTGRNTKASIFICGRYVSEISKCQNMVRIFCSFQMRSGPSGVTSVCVCV